MKTIRMSILLIAVLVMTILYGCSSGVENQTIEVAPAETPSIIRGEQPVQTAPETLGLIFSFCGNQIDIENLPEYIPHRNVLLSIQNLSETEKEFYILFAQIYQYLHSGNFDFVSAYQQSNASNMFLRNNFHFRHMTIIQVNPRKENGV